MVTEFWGGGGGASPKTVTWKMKDNINIDVRNVGREFVTWMALVSGSRPVLAFAMLKRQGLLGPVRTPKFFKQPKQAGSMARSV
jgi:hypothetical protein